MATTAMGRCSASSVAASNRPAATTRSTMWSASASMVGVISRMRSGRSGRPSTLRIVVWSGGSEQSVMPSRFAFICSSTNTLLAEEKVRQSISAVRTSA